MKNKTASHKGIKDNYILLGMALGAFFWLLEAFVHVYIFHERNLVQEIFTPTAHEIWMRLATICFVIAFAVIAQFIIARCRRAEEDAKQTNAELDQIFNTAADGMRVIDKDFNVLRINNTLLALAGISAEEAKKGKKCYEMFPGPQCHTPDCSMVKVLGGGKDRLEADVEKERPDGTRVPCLLTATPFLGNSGEILGIVEDFKDITVRKRNEEELRKHRFHLEETVAERTVELTAANKQLQQEITERKKAERVMRESEERFRIAAESAGDLIYEWDILSGCLKWFNGIDELLGFVPGEFPRKMEAWEKIIHPEDSARVMAAIKRHLKTREPYFQEYRLRRRDGAFLYWTDSGTALWDENGQPYKWIGVGADITAQRQAEKARSKSENLYRRLFDEARDAVFIFDLETGLILNANKQAEKLLNLIQEEIIGLHQSKLFPPDEIDKYQGILNEFVKTGAGLPKLAEVFTGEGRKVPVEISASILQVTGGQKLIQAFFRDISERKWAEEEKEKMQRQLFGIQKIEAVGTLAGGIAHDFNNLLTAVTGNLSLIKLYLKSEDKAFGILQEAENASRQAKHLTQQLLTFSKGGAPVKKLVSISKLLKNAVIFALSGSKARCELFLPDDLWSAEVDEGQINQVINNLVINADQAMAEGGIVRVSAENRLIRGKEALPLKDGKYVRISVKDQGCGIAEEFLQKIFDPYFTTKPEGTGLGLSISYSIIKKHNGHITIDSGERGTIFSIYLPSSEKEIFKVEEEEVEEKLFPGRNKILFMDDQPNLRCMVGEMLAYLGHEFESAGDGAEAIELYKKAKEAGRPFDAVILDLTVPGGMGGMEAIQGLLKIDPEVKVIVSSGYSNDPIMSEYTQYGFSGAVAKPYEIGELSKIVNQVIKENEIVPGG